MNSQRESIYKWRTAILEGRADEERISDWIADAMTATIEEVVSPGSTADSWDWETLIQELQKFYPTAVTPESLGARASVDDLIDHVVDEASPSTRAGRRSSG